MASTVISYATWSFLPGVSNATDNQNPPCSDLLQMVSGWIQSIYYGIAIRAGDPKPAPGSPRYQKHRRRIQITVIVVYLLYTVYEADYWIRKTGDFYQTLGVSITADEKRIKSKFRRLAALHHPDKVVSDDPAAVSSADAYYVLLKSAQDTLTDPVKRFAYQRFGPDVLQWQHCSSIRDYILRGLTVSCGPLYAGSLIFMTLLAFTGYLQRGKFWRFVLFAALAVLEMHIITRPYMPPILDKFLNPILENITRHPPLLPFQLIQLARKIIFTAFIALSQIGALLPPPSTIATAPSTSQQDLQQLTRLENIAKTSDAEAARLLAMETAPFVTDEQATRDLSSKVKEWLVNNTIRADPEVRDAMGRAMTKRRMGAPPKARG